MEKFIWFENSQNKDTLLKQRKKGISRTELMTEDAMSHKTKMGIKVNFLYISSDSKILAAICVSTQLYQLLVIHF